MAPLKVAGALESGFAAFGVMGRVVKKMGQGAADSGFIVWIDEDGSGCADFGGGTDVGGDDRGAAGHGFERGQAEPFVERGKEKDRGQAVKSAEFVGVDVLELDDAAFEVGVLHEAVESVGGAAGEATDEDEIKVFAVAECFEKTCQGAGVVFVGRSLADDEDEATVRGKLFLELLKNWPAFFWADRVKKWIEAVVGDVDAAFCSREIVFDFGFGVFGNREDAAGLCDRAGDELLIEGAGDDFSPTAVGTIVDVEQPHDVVQGEDSWHGQVGREDVER